MYRGKGPIHLEIRLSRKVRSIQVKTILKSMKGDPKNGEACHVYKKTQHNMSVLPNYKFKAISYNHSKVF